MLRTLTSIARLSRMSPNIHARILSPATIINNVRFKYQNREGGGGDKTGRRKPPQASSSLHDDDDGSDAGDPLENDNDNLLDDK